MAARSVNKVILIGHLGKDAENQTTPSGIRVSRFSIATTRSWKDPKANDWKEETNWTNVVLWRQENIAEYLKKGKQVYVEGRLQTRSYEDHDGRRIWTTKVIAKEVLLLAGKSEPTANGNRNPENSRAGNGYPNSRSERAQETEEAELGITEDDVPF